MPMIKHPRSRGVCEVGHERPAKSKNRRTAAGRPMGDHVRVPRFDASLTPRAEAKRILFRLGMELPSERSIDYAVRLRRPEPAGVDVPRDERIRRAMAAIEDGPVALVAENPELRNERLADPALTVAAAADAIVFALGERLIDAARPPPVNRGADCE
jgi:hypothetical protein